jgi:hypothetical protein
MPNDVFSHIKVAETTYDVKDATARADISTLSGVVDTKVPQTRTVNGKALSSDISLGAADIGYDNTGSGMTADDVQSAVDELDTALDGKVPNTRTVNNKALSANITLNAGDIGYNNTGTNLSGTDLQATTTELDGRVYALEQGGGSGWTITYGSVDEKLTFTAS